MLHDIPDDTQHTSTPPHVTLLNCNVYNNGISEFILSWLVLPLGRKQIKNKLPLV